MALINQAGLIKLIEAMESVEKCLSCAICLEISSDPVETRCGHLFCCTCIKKVLSHPSKLCPICKRNMTRRSFSTSHQMVLCIRQLSKLRDAIRNDTNIDITTCLEMHYKKTASLPSISSSSMQSLQDVQKHMPLSESDNNMGKEFRHIIDDASHRAGSENRCYWDGAPTRVLSIVNDEAFSTKRIDVTNLPKNVPFKKCGHLFKARRKCVIFLYCGSMNQQESKLYGINGSPAVYERCWSSIRSHELHSIREFDVESIAQCNETEPSTSPVAMQKSFENVSHSQKQIMVPALCAARSPDLHRSIDYEMRDNPESRPMHKKGLITPIVMTATISLDQWESHESSIGKRKRKRSKSPDQSNNCSKKLSCSDNVESCWQDCLSEKAPSPRAISRTAKIAPAKTHKIYTTEVSEALDHKIADANPENNDFQETSSLQETNTTLSTPIKKSSSKRNPSSLKTRPLSTPHTTIAEQNVEACISDEADQINLSQDSIMNITAEELLWKEFEENLFRSRASQNRRRRIQCNEYQRQDNERGFDVHEKTNPDASTIAEPTSSESANQSVIIPETVSTKIVEFRQCNESQKNAELVALGTMDQSLNHSKSPTRLWRHDGASAVQSSIEILQNHERNKSVACPLPEPRYIQTRTQISSGQRETDQSTLNAHRRNVADTSFSISKFECNASSSFPDRDVARSHRGCILGSGLTTRQSEDVRHFSSLFNMQYTKKFSDSVSHVIVKTNDEDNGACKTLKYLQGIAYRKWVLSFDWIVDCITKRTFLNEETYEVVDGTSSIPGPKKARVGESSPFTDFVFFCVEPFQSITVPDYEDLLRHTGAIVVGSLSELAAHPSILKIIVVQAECHEQKIIEWHQATRAVPVAQEWIFECISQYQLVTLLPFLQELVAQDVLDLGFPEKLVQDELM